MPEINVGATEVLVAQSGLATGSQLAAAGVARRHRSNLSRVVVSAPAIAFKSVYQLSANRVTFEESLIALTLAHRGSFITGTTAGRLLGARRLPNATEIQLRIPHGRRFDTPAGVTLRQSRAITDADWRTLSSGLRIASWPRLVFDLAEEVPPLALRSVIEQVLHQKWATEPELAEIARRLCHPRRPGSMAFQAALDARRGRPPVESDAELLVLEGLLARGVPVVPQHLPARGRGDKPARVDLSVPDAKWAVEVDLHPSHTVNGGAQDKRRDRSLHRRGWQIERVPPDDLDDLDALCDELADLYFTRLAAA